MTFYEVIKDFGFPIAVAIALAWFIINQQKRNDKKEVEREILHQKEMDKKDALLEKKDAKISEIADKSINFINDASNSIKDIGTSIDSLDNTVQELNSLIEKNKNN